MWDWKLDAVAFSDDGVVAAAAPFARVLVDCTTDSAEKKAFRRLHGVTGYPSVLFLAPDGRLIERMGPRDPAAVAAQCRRIGAMDFRAVGPAGEDPPAPLPVLRSIRVTRPIELRCLAADPDWALAPPLAVVVKRPLPPRLGESGNATLRSVHTGTHLYLLVTWDDATKDVTHKTWTWDGTAYAEGKDREDMCSLAFAHTGPFTDDMLAGVESTWDVWHWKACRTAPHGYASDKIHRYTRTKPEGKAAEHTARDGRPVWIARPEDAGESSERKQPAPATFVADTVPQFVATLPTGSAADVEARALWSRGRWTVVLGRRLDTGHPDDTVFVPGQSVRFALSTFDHTGEMDKATGVCTLVLDGPAK